MEKKKPLKLLKVLKPRRHRADPVTPDPVTSRTPRDFEVPRDFSHLFIDDPVTSRIY